MSLQAKRILRKKTPRFHRHAFHRKASLDSNWRKPRGLHNKQKDHKKGSFPGVSSGYRTPLDVRHKHISGYEIVTVADVSQLAGIQPKTQAVVVAAVGARSQLEILQACQEQKVKVLNHRIEERIASLQAKHAAAKKAAEENRKQKAEKAKKKSEKKPEKELTEEEKKEEQEKLKEEVLTGKQ